MTKFEEKFAIYAPYLEEIGRRLAIVGLFFLAIFVVSFFSSVPLLRLFSKFFVIKNVTIITVSPFQFLDLAMNTAISIALICSLPMLIVQIYLFLKTGLTIKEKIRFFMYLPIVFVLFIIGFLYGFFTLYATFGAIAQINLNIGMQNYWDISKLLSQIFITAALLGLLFEFPLVLSALIKLKLFDVRYLKARRRHAVAIIFIGTSLLPPTDGVSLLVMVAPLILLYELTIYLNTREIINLN